MVQTAERRLYLVLGDGMAIRYTVAVGRFSGKRVPRRPGLFNLMSAGGPTIPVTLSLGLGSDARLGRQTADGGAVHPKEPREIRRTLPA